MKDDRMQTVPFYKMSGSGNDFIIIDNRAGAWDRLRAPGFVRAVCRRQISVGADGVIFIERSDRADFSWRFFNADGSEAEMCGNGARCAARFALVQGIAAEKLSFATIAGIIHAEVYGTRVKTQLTRPGVPEMNIELAIDGAPFVFHSINTGVPHVVCFVDALERVAVSTIGRSVRFHKRFQPAGTNVNFVSQSAGDMLQIRTYERGVEDETLACGTGSVAAALIAIALGRAASPVRLQTRSGDILMVYAAEASAPFSEVYLEGETTVVYTGELWEEGYGGVQRIGAS
jgi:diaminopimelate epimerase